MGKLQLRHKHSSLAFCKMILLEHKHIVFIYCLYLFSFNRKTHTAHKNETIRLNMKTLQIGKVVAKLSGHSKRS